MRSLAIVLSLLCLSLNSGDATADVLMLEPGPIHLGDADHGPVVGCVEETGVGQVWSTSFAVRNLVPGAVVDFLFEYSALHDATQVHVNGVLVGLVSTMTDWCDWQTASFSITSYLVEGMNTVSLTVGYAAGLDNSAYQHMEVRSAIAVENGPRSWGAIKARY